MGTLLRVLLLLAFLAGAVALITWDDAAHEHDRCRTSHIINADTHARQTVTICEGW